MIRVSVFLSVALLAASLGVAAQDGARRPNNPPAGNAQISQAHPGNSSVVKNSSPNATTGEPAKRIQGADEGSENLVENGAPLPQTSTILPLLGFIGLGSLVAGLFARR